MKKNLFCRCIPNKNTILRITLLGAYNSLAKKYPNRAAFTNLSLFTFQ